tara:strand:- start:257 stop:778 length:522 start_codon:yes stop_codon:yes gene_type:complete
MKPSIACVDRALDPEAFRFVSEFAYDAPYEYGERDNALYKPTGMIHNLEPDDEDDNFVYELLDRVIREKFPEVREYNLYRAYINCFAPREIANFHVDCSEDDDQLTFIFYANKKYNGLNDGGCTEFYLDDKIIGLPPVPNTLVKFTSWVLHRATPLISDHRFTYAFKYRKETD